VSSPLAVATKSKISCGIPSTGLISNAYLKLLFFLLTNIPASPAHEIIRSAVQSAMLKSSPVFGDFALWSVFSATVKFVAAVPSVQTSSKEWFPADRLLRYSGLKVMMVDPSVTV